MAYCWAGKLVQSLEFKCPTSDGRTLVLHTEEEGGGGEQKRQKKLLVEKIEWEDLDFFMGAFADPTREPSRAQIDRVSRGAKKYFPPLLVLLLERSQENKSNICSHS